MRRALCAFVLVVLAACGGDDADAEPEADAGAIDVATALQRDDGTRMTVTGHLIALPDGTAQLCGGPIQESAPPRCGDPFLAVDGLEDPASIPGATEVGGWVEGDVELAGIYDNGRLNVS